jgi:hypothetical protein
VSALLKRAVELQSREGVTSLSGPQGFSLTELEEIAAEAGIAPIHLRRAAAELESHRATSGDWTWATGEPVTLVRERIVPGELPAEAFEALVAEIQTGAGARGQPSLVGRTLTWQTDTPTRDRSLHVVVAARDGETRIHIEERLHQLAGGLFGGLMGGVGGGVGLGVGMGVGLGALGSVLFATLFPVGVIGLSFVAARRTFSAVSRRRQRVLDGLVERLVAAVEAAVEPSSDARTALPPGSAGAPAQEG